MFRKKKNDPAQSEGTENSPQRKSVNDAQDAVAPHGHAFMARQSSVAKTAIASWKARESPICAKHVRRNNCRKMSRKVRQLLLLSA